MCRGVLQYLFYAALMNNAYSFTGFQLTPFFAQIILLETWFDSLLLSEIPRADNDKKKILKSKCCFQLSDFITPPHEHGKCTFESNMIVI